MNIATEPISVTDLRSNLHTILKSVDSNKNAFMIMSRSRPRAVLVDINTWREQTTSPMPTADPFDAFRKKHGDILGKTDVVQQIRSSREKRWNLS